MATNFNPATKISVSGPLSISDKRSADMPLDIRGRIETLTDITTIPFAWEGMLVYVRDTKKYYKVTSLANRTAGGVAIPYYPATWVEFGSGGSTPSPSPTPSDIDAGDVSYFSSGTFSNNTVGKELQSLASDILSLAEDIHNLSGDIGTLSNLNTENKQDLVAAINEVLASTGSTITIINNLISDSTTDALSAYQGKVLKGLVDGKVAGIKVQGESSVLPMDGNGIVTIPAGGGGGTGTITGATVGGNPVTAIGGILQFDAYPTANTMQYSSSTNYNSGTIGKEVKDLNKSVNDLSTQVAELDKPSPTPSPSTTVVNLAEYATSSSSFTYDVDNKYIYNTKDTTFYQYSEEDNDTTVYYGVFKVIGEDMYLMYSITNNTTFTYVNTYTELTLPENAKKEFALGSVAVIKRVNGEGESWKNGTVNLFCTKQNMALRNRCRNINFNGSTAWRVLIKSEDGNTIFVYKAKSNGNYEWEINVPRSSTANFNLLDKYFDRPEASNVSFDDSVTQLGTQEDPVTDVQTAINQLATGIQGLTGKLKVRLLYQNSTPVTNKEVSILAYYRGASYDISSQYSPSTGGFKTDSNGYVINSNSNEYLVLPLGATYTITLYDISDNYITPEVKTGIIDANTVTVNCIYNNVSNIEFVKVYVQTPNTPVTIANVENKKVYVDFYTGVTSHALQYVCLLRANGTIKQILEADGTTQATYNDEPLISDTEPVLIPVPNGTKYTCALQEWDETISSENQRYVKSANQTYTASKAKRSLTFTYTDKQLGLFLLVEDSTQSKGYRSCLITEINSTTNFKIKDIVQNESVSYIITRSNSNVYRQIEGDSNQELWEEEILGVGVRTSQSIFESNDDLETQGEYPDCSFFVPIDIVTVSSMQMLNEDTTKVSLPTNYGGLYITKCLYNLGPSPTSPAAHKVIDETTFDITLQTPNSNKTIKGFIPSSQQALIVRGCLSNFNNIWNIVKGSGFSIPGSQTNFWTCTDGKSTMYNNTFMVYTRSTISTPNPATNVGTVAMVLFAIYPF